VSEVVDEQGQTPERRPNHLRFLFMQMVGNVCLSFIGAEGLADSEELNGANGREGYRKFVNYNFNHCSFWGIVERL